MNFLDKNIDGGYLLGCGEASQECHYRCCDQSKPGTADFCQENALLLYPGEWESAEGSKSHIDISVENDHEGKLGYCAKERFDQSSCHPDKNFKPLDCKSYPFFPTIIDGKMKMALDVMRCPLSRDPQALLQHYNYILSLWLAVAEKNPSVIEWIKTKKLDGYIIYDPKND